jgi:PadR family transcriptional regulator PadR
VWSTVCSIDTVHRRRPDDKGTRLHRLFVAGSWPESPARRVEQLTHGAFQVNPGSLFPALHRLEQKGWLKSEWGASATNRKAKYYRLTAAGRRQLKAETENWARISVAIARALRPAEGT